MTQEEGRAKEVGRCHCEEPGKRCEELPQVAILALGQHVPSRAEVLRAWQTMGGLARQKQGPLCDARGLAGCRVGAWGFIT